MTSVYICDDDTSFRNTLKNLITSDKRLTLTGEGTDGAQGLREIAKLAPAICFIDLLMPHMDGVDLITQLRKKGVSTKIIVVSQTYEESWIDRLIPLNISAFVMKTDDVAHLHQAITSVLGGDTYFSPRIGSVLYKKLGQRYQQRSVEIESHGLTPKELVVAELVSQGKTVREIAEHLSCSENTVKTHKLNLMRKLDAKNSSEVTSWYLTKIQA